MLVTLAGCHQAAKPARTGPQKVTITGKILTARGTPPLRADAHVAVTGAKMVSVQAAKDGSFTIEAPVKTAFRLRLSAVNHVEADLPVFFASAAPASITVKLALDPFDHNAKDVQISATDTRHLSLHDAVPMKKQEDGTFVWEKDAEAPEIRYELIGICTNGHSINGTQSDSFVYDGGGDYESIVHPVNGHVRVVYDPAKLPAPVEGAFPVVSWDPAHAALNTIARLSIENDAHAARVGKAQRAYFEKHHNVKGFTPDNAATVKNLQDAMASAKSPLVRAYAAVLLINVKAESGSEFLKTPGFMTSVLSAAPPSSPAWAFQPRSLDAVASLGDKAPGIYERFVKENHSRQVQAYALYFQAVGAMSKGNTALQTKLYTALKSNYAGVPPVKYLLGRINPNKAIQIGKAVPAFSATLLDGKKISNKSLLGHYTLLDFWATWCAPCRAEMPNLDAAWKKFHRHNFQIISFSFDNSPEAISTFRKGKWKMPWKHVFVKGGFRSALATAFEVQGIPEPILVGPDGKIIAVAPQTRGPGLLATIKAAMELSKATKK